MSIVALATFELQYIDCDCRRLEPISYRLWFAYHFYCFKVSFFEKTNKRYVKSGLEKYVIGKNNLEKLPFPNGTFIDVVRKAKIWIEVLSFRVLISRSNVLLKRYNPVENRVISSVNAHRKNKKEPFLPIQIVTAFLWQNRILCRKVSRILIRWQFANQTD